TGRRETIRNGTVGKSGPVFDPPETLFLRCSNQPTIAYDRSRRVGMKRVKAEDQQSASSPRPDEHHGREHWQSVQLEFVLSLSFQSAVLVNFPQKTVARNQHVQFASHKTAEGVIGRANNRLAPDVEACVHQ